jgi:ribosomal protein S18 acetylase RimI-like enzyme
MIFSSLKEAMIIRPTVAGDWTALKAIRLAALRDAPTAFGVSHAAASANMDDQWRARAAGAAGPAFWLAWADDESRDPVGLAGGGVDAAGRYNLIAMWVAPPARGTGLAALLAAAVLERAVALGHARVVLDVAPDNLPAVALYRRLGFAFVDEWEPLASHPHIQVQRMAWLAPHAAQTT